VWQPSFNNGVAVQNCSDVEPSAASTSQATGARILAYDLPLP
jgi:hypothetical protein